MNRLLSLLFAALLTGCWTGGPFYAASESRPTVPEGRYELQGPGGERDNVPVRVTHLPDGLVQLAPVDDPSDRTTVGLAPLPGTEGVYVMWMTAIDGELLPEDGTFYGLLGSAGGNGFQIHFPTCNELEEIPAGSERIPDKFSLCRFADRASLEEALRGQVPSLAQGARLIPVGRAP